MDQLQEGENTKVSQDAMVPNIWYIVIITFN